MENGRSLKGSPKKVSDHSKFEIAPNLSIQEILEIVLVGVLVFVITKNKRGLSFRNYEN